MRVRHAIVFFGAVLVTTAAAAQAPSRPQAPPAATQLHSNLIQLMRGILLPLSNVVFFAQSEDPAAVPSDEQAATSPNPLKLPRPAYGGWVAVENSALALAESANLLTIPGRRCANGRLAPIDNADWIKWVQGLRDAATLSYKAAQSQNQDRVLDAAEQLTIACANCHTKYRDTPKEPLDRC